MYLNCFDSNCNFVFILASSILKREKRKRTKNVHFNCVTVYYFTRRQGFTSVPSQGGSTLGMSTRHNSMRQYTLGEFAMEQERLHREMLRDHLREEKLNSLKLKVKKGKVSLCLPLHKHEIISGIGTSLAKINKSKKSPLPLTSYMFPFSQINSSIFFSK